MNTHVKCDQTSEYWVTFIIVLLFKVIIINKAYKKIFFDEYYVLIHSIHLNSVQRAVTNAKLTFTVVNRREMSSSSQSRSLLGGKMNFFSVSVQFWRLFSTQ